MVKLNLEGTTPYAWFCLANVASAFSNLENPAGYNLAPGKWISGLPSGYASAEIAGQDAITKGLMRSQPKENVQLTWWSLPNLGGHVAILDNGVVYSSWDNNVWHIFKNTDEITIAFKQAYPNENVRFLGFTNQVPINHVWQAIDQTNNKLTSYVVNAEKLNVRQEPRMSSIIVANYEKGQIINIDENSFTIRDGYVWASYVGASGKTRWVAVGPNTGKAESNDFLIKKK